MLSPRKKPKIIVIGNGPADRPLGHIIDSFDEVVRFNNFALKGYEKYVGSKTTIWCFSSNQVQAVRSNSYPCKTIFVVQRRFDKNIKKIVYKTAEKKKATITVLPLSVEESAIKMVKHTFPSTGLVLLTYLVEKIDQFQKPIYITGFNGFSKFNVYHYYWHPHYRAPTHHDGNQEMNFIHQMIDKGLICDLQNPITLL